jgi:hypothetical protein
MAFGPSSRQTLTDFSVIRGLESPSSQKSPMYRSNEVHEDPSLLREVPGGVEFLYSDA